MVYEKISIHPLKLENRISLFKITAPQVFDKVMNHLKALSNGEITGNKISEARQRKLIDMFSIFFKNYKKPLAKITFEDLRKFKEDLLNDKITKLNGSGYSEKTKEDCIETIRRYIEVEYPQIVGKLNSRILPFRKWFVIKAKRKTPEIISESEVEKLVGACKTIEGKFVVVVLFSSGCRIEEFLNLRFEDIEEPTQNFPYYRFDFKEEYSKTQGRKIGLYWKNSTEIINTYLSSCEFKEPKVQIFPKGYDAIRMFLSRLGQKTLNKRIHPHLLRKGSATYYAPLLNRQELCLRFGWRFSSSMPDIYISRAGLDEEKIKERVLNTDLSKIQTENRELNTKFDLLKEQNKKFFKEMLRINLEMITTALNKNEVPENKIGQAQEIKEKWEKILIEMK